MCISELAINCYNGADGDSEPDGHFVLTFSIKTVFFPLLVRVFFYQFEEIRAHLFGKYIRLLQFH